MTVVSPFLTFPNISWWAQVYNAGTVMLDGHEHFEKMTGRNRYRISGANNSILLSVPLVSGRDQHKTMKDVRIYNHDKWQVQHWRTLVSVYRRSPFFEHYEAGLAPLFEQQYEWLTDFNRAGLEWVRAQLKMGFAIEETAHFQKAYERGITDLRREEQIIRPEPFPHYYQVFEDRIGFQPDLSILDLLFSEGPAAMNRLNK